MVKLANVTLPPFFSHLCSPLLCPYFHHSLTPPHFLQGISEMLQQKNVRLDETQVCEAAELRRKLQSELELLMAYQVRLGEK